MSLSFPLNKKAEISSTFIIMLILSLSGLGIGTLLINKVGEGTTKSYDKQLCKFSVVENSKYRLPVANEQVYPLDCPTRYVSFEKDKANFESRNFKGKKKITCGNLNNNRDRECFLKKSNEVIADLIFDCWDQFAAGQVEVLSPWEENRQCVLCARFEFSQDVQQRFKEIGSSEIAFTSFRGDTPKTDFTLDNYMRSHNPPHHKISYYEFSLDALDAYKFPYYDYNLQEPYAVVFRAMNKHQITRLIDGAWDFISENHLQNTADEGDFINVMDIVKYSEVETVCDTLE